MMPSLNAHSKPRVSSNGFPRTNSSADRSVSIACSVAQRFACETRALEARQVGRHERTEPVEVSTGREVREVLSSVAASTETAARRRDGGVERPRRGLFPPQRRLEPLVRRAARMQGKVRRQFDAPSAIEPRGTSDDVDGAENAYLDLERRIGVRLGRDRVVGTCQRCLVVEFFRVVIPNHSVRQEFVECLRRVVVEQRRLNTKAEGREDEIVAVEHRLPPPRLLCHNNGTDAVPAFSREHAQPRNDVRGQRGRRRRGSLGPSRRRGIATNGRRACCRIALRRARRVSHETPLRARTVR